MLRGRPPVSSNAGAMVSDMVAAAFPGLIPK